VKSHQQAFALVVHHSKGSQTDVRISPLTQARYSPKVSARRRHQLKKRRTMQRCAKWLSGSQRSHRP